MNKGFFVVFLGIIVGAMALIFFNQASTPRFEPSETRTVAEAPASPEGNEPAPVETEPAKPEPTQPVQAAQPGQSGPQEPPAAVPDPAEAGAAKPEAVQPEAAKPEPAKPETVKPELAKPEAVKPEPAKPEAAKPEPAKPAPAKTVTPAPVKKSLVLKNIGLHLKDKGIALRIEADGGFSYKTLVLPDPDRYVVDLAGSWSGMRVPSIPSNTLVKSVRVGSQAGGPRLVLDLLRAPKKHRAAWIAPTVLEIYLE